jgi:hypothetical protein
MSHLKIDPQKHLDSIEKRKNIMASLETDEDNRKGELNRIKLLKGSVENNNHQKKMSKRVAF